MKLRTIMIFPEFDNIEVIDKIREQYDPLANLVRPHITIVFPFDSDRSNEELKAVLENRLQSVKSFKLEMAGVRKHEDRFGNYLFLEVTQGEKELCHIHDVLYKNEFSDYDLGLPYVPHITIGKMSERRRLDEAYNKVKNMSETFGTIINKVSVEMIGDNEESIIVAEIALS